MEIQKIVSNKYFQLFILVLSICLTILSYYNEPIRFSEMKMMSVPNNIIYVIEGYISFILYVIIMIWLYQRIGFFKLPSFWFVPFLIIGLTIYTHIFKTTMTYSKSDTFSPPPTDLFYYKDRIVVNSIILVLDMVLLGSLSLSLINMDDENIIQSFKLDFNNFVLMIMIIKILIDIINLRNTIYFIPCEYNLPTSWSL
jgi:hypothetical protein